MDKSDIRVCIIDYGSGNVRSVFNIFRSIHDAVKISNVPQDITDATHLVLPGVGAFGAAMQKIKDLPVFDLLEEQVLRRKKPFLGICVGMQVLADEGLEYGRHEGLGWLPGVVKKIGAPGLMLPQIGWNNLAMVKKNALLEGITEDVDFYFVHSYYLDAKDAAHVAATCEYGMEFPAVVNRDNIYGVQFHPEKSQKAGKALLENFLGAL